MRLRLVHKLSLLMLSFALLAVLALGGLTAWNLRQGFGEYLAARELVRLEKLRDLVEDKLRLGAGQADRLQDLSLHALLNEIGGLPMDAPPPFAGERPPPEDKGPGFWGARPPPPRHGEAWPERVSMLDRDGQTLQGRQTPPFATGHVDRPVRREGQVVGWVRMYRTDAIDPQESHFLRQQYVVIVGVSVALVLLSLISAGWLARRWVKPLSAVAHTTGQLARGDFSARLPTRHPVGVGRDEIGDVVLHINRMAESLQSLEQSRRRWLADISHELRTPLTVMQGDIEALCDGVRPLTAQAVQVLRTDVHQLSQLVNDLHLLAVADLQALPCHFAPMDAAELMHKLVQRYASRAQAQGLQLDLQVGDALGEVVWDVVRIEQLCVNLLENSIRYTHAPGHVLLSLFSAHGRMVIEVEDSAPGVPAQDWIRLFEPLYRADASRARTLGGTGLGLSIAQAIVKAHGGDIEARASQHGGLCIHIELPQQAHMPSDVKGGLP